MKRPLSNLLPPFVRPAARFLYYLPVDAFDSLRGRDPMIPPRSLAFIGSGDFETIGKEFFDYFVRLGKLKPTDKVLDIGSGTGRMAVPLTRYLSGSGEYWGFDVVKKGVDWCNRSISRRYPGFHFLHGDICNKCYNPRGRFSDGEYRFPFESGTFDFVFLTSVFTHLLPDGLENYISEMSRVLKPGGRSLSTFFLLTDEARRLLAEGRSRLDFRFEHGGCLTIDRDVPELSIAYDEDRVRGFFEAAGLEIEPPVRYGSWPGRSEFLSFQDIILASRS
jgi:SAM-dependent methyltransferase